MASTINGTSTGSGGLISSGDDSGILNIQTNETTAIAVDASQNVGVGVTPNAWATLVPAIQLGSGSTFLTGRTGLPEMYLGTNAYYNGSAWIYKNTNVATLYSQDTGNHKWYVAASGTAGNTATFSEKMSLDTNGVLLLNTTSSWGGSPRMEVRQSGSGWGLSSYSTGAAGGSLLLRVDNTACVLAGFYYTGSVNVGSISTNGTSTTYGTASDYRLKEDIQPMTGALAKVAALNPVTYKWKSSGEQDNGFIAHELAEVVPNAVNGEKDAVNEDGSIKPQGIDTSFLVATLTAAIKEQQAIIESQSAAIQTLTQRITALEGA